MSVGDFLVRRNAANTDAIPPTGSGDLLLLWDTLDSSKGSAVTYSGGTFTLADAGKYLVMCSDFELGLGTVDNSRINTKMTLNVDSVELLGGYATGYIRNIMSSGQTECITYSTSIIDVSAGAALQVRKERIDDTNQDSNRKASDRSGITVIKLDDNLDFGMYSGLLFATSSTDNASVVADISVTSEQGSSLSRSGNIVTVNETGRYLASYSLKSEDLLASDRSEYQAHLSVNGSEYHGSWSHAYIRGSDDCVWGGMSNTSLLNLTAGDEIELQVVSREGGGETFLATLQLMQLPDAAKTITTTASSGDFTILDIDFIWSATEYIDTDTFAFINGTNTVTVLADDDYIALSSQASEQFKSHATGRLLPAVQFKKNGTDLNIAGDSCYVRSIDNAGYATLTTGGLISALTADLISVYNNRLGTYGTSIQCDSGAMSLLQLSSLVGEEPAEGNVSDIAFDVPAPEFSIDATVTAPSVSSDILFSIPIPEFSITVETTAPGVSSDVTFNMPAPEFNIEASVTAPNVISNISFDIPSPEFNIGVSVGNDSVSNIELDIPGPEFAVNATVTVPNVSSDVSFNVPTPEFDISVSVGSPGNHSIVEFDVPSPEFSISASITAPTVNSTIEFTIPAPEFKGEESVIIVDDRAIVTYIAKSSVVEYNAETSVIKYNTPTNIVKLR